MSDIPNLRGGSWQGPLLGFVVVAALLLWPILGHLHLPMTDLPNHIARHWVASYQGGPLDQYYDYQLGLVPNTAADLAWIMFGDGENPAKFSQRLFAVYAVALVAATMLLARVLHGRWTLWSLAVAVVVFNANFFWGFQNYLVSMPFAIFVLAIWLWSERLVIWWRMALLSPLVVALFILHFFAFAFLAIAVFGREIQRLIEGKGARARILGQAVLLALPFLSMIVWLAIDVLTGPPNPSGTGMIFGDMTRRLHVLQSITQATRQILTPMLHLSGAVIIALVLVFAAALRLRWIGGGLHMARPMVGPMLVLIVAALFTPFILNGVAWVNIRFPFAVVALFFAATVWRRPGRIGSAVLAVLLLAVVVWRSVALDAYIAAHDREVRDFIAVTEDVPGGDRLFFARIDARRSDVRLWHVSAYAVTYHDVFVPSLFQGVHAFSVLPQWQDHATPAIIPLRFEALLSLNAQPEVRPQLQFARDWQDKYQYLVLMGSSADGFDRWVGHPDLEPIGTQGRFRLFRITANDS